MSFHCKVFIKNKNRTMTDEEIFDSISKMFQYNTEVIEKHYAEYVTCELDKTLGCTCLGFKNNNCELNISLAGDIAADITSMANLNNLQIICVGEFLTHTSGYIVDGDFVEDGSEK